MKKNSFKKNDKYRMYKYFKNLKGSIILLVLLTLISCVIGIINPIVNANLLTNLTELNIEASLKFAIIMVVLCVIVLINGYILNIVYLKNIKQKFMINIRKDIIKNIFDMEIVNFDNHSSGEFTNRILNDPENIASILSVFQFSFLNLLKDIFVICYIVYLNYILGIIYIISLLFIYRYEKVTMKKLKNLSEKNNNVKDKNTGLLNEIVRGIRDIKILNLTTKVHDMVIKGLNESTVLDGKKSIKSNTSFDIISFFQSITIFVVIIVGLFLVNNGILTATNLIIIYMYKTNVYDISLCYRSVKEYLNEYSISSKRIFEFIDNNIYKKESFGDKEISDIKGKIEFKNLSFAYEQNKVLNNINMIINPNDTIGIVGASGSGKTTLLNLLSKSYTVDNNKIFIDNIDINNLSKDSIRNNISVISQNPYIFNLTIKENLELIGNDITKKEIINACKVAQIHDYIMTLPNKYDTLLGESGISLSGGQKQRLAIARALLKRSKIIIFDEATSALDNVTQNELQKSINNISADYTLIIVAHRLSTIKDCSRIYVMDKGKIVGEGTHQNLLKNNEYYKKLYQTEIK